MSQQKKEFGWAISNGKPSTNYGWVSTNLTNKTSTISVTQEITSVTEDKYVVKEVPKEQLRLPFRFSRKTEETQDYLGLRRKHFISRTLFEDPDFPAIQSSLSHSGKLSQQYVWLRPKEICDNPEFFVEGFSRFDVRQGTIGNCWFLAAVANLTQNLKYFNEVVPSDNSFNENYAGIFHFRFWQYGKWVDVVVDDRLPTYRGQLVFMHSADKNEFWSALLEKAYAKLHGSYETLWGGNTCEAMADFTGGIIEMYEMPEAPKDLYQILERSFKNNSMMSASLQPDPHEVEAVTPQGLIKGHAYSITKVQAVDIATTRLTGKIQLIRLRNPWGDGSEWNGPFSDKSPEWRCIPEMTKTEMGLEFKDDGEFWMTFKDFQKYIDRVEMCHLSPDCIVKDPQEKNKNWKITTYEGEWTKGVSAGGCRNFIDTFWLNPQYVMSLKEPDVGDKEGLCTVVIALMQKYRRTRKNMDIGCLNIGFVIYKVTEKQLEEKPLKKDFFLYNASFARCPVFMNIREISCRFRFEPGNYLIVPSTYEAGKEGEFLIRIFSQSRNQLAENDLQWGAGKIDVRVANVLPDPVKPTAERTSIENLFLDVSGDDREIDWSDLQGILNHCMKDGKKFNN